MGRTQTPIIDYLPRFLTQTMGARATRHYNLPSQILDANTWRQLKSQGIANPLNNHCINILSYHFAARLEEQLLLEPWHLVVMDEAHKLRNAYIPALVYVRCVLQSLLGGLSVDLCRRCPCNAGGTICHPQTVVHPVASISRTVPVMSFIRAWQ